jgi:transcriptional regulator with XRE-family HTH domain
MPKRPQRKIDGGRLTALMQERGVKNLPLATAIGVAASQIKRWKDNKTAAMPDAVRALAVYFHVSEAFLYGLDAGDARERLAAELARTLGTPEAEIVRALGAVAPERRQMLAGKLLGWIEAETSMPLADRKSSVSIVRRSASGEAPAKDGGSEESETSRAPQGKR